MRSSPLRLVLPLALALGTAACGGDSTSPTPSGNASVAGTFALQSVNGAPLPTVPPNHWDRLDSESLVLTGGNFTVSTVMSELDGGAVVRTYNLFDSGTVTVNGSTLTFDTGSLFGPWSGTLSGNTITVDRDHGDMGTSTYVYVKQ